MFDEKEILEFWEKNKVFEKSVNQRKLRRNGRSKKDFVFFEGPPTANGKPHIGHFATRVFKDIVLRYKTMRGFYAPRRAGWDTHGLPVEVEVEKNLGLKSKKEIEAYGVAVFNKKCRESVWKYKNLWEEFTKRMGFWIDMAHPYITYENSYIEALWGVIKNFADKKLLYEDYKVMPWCARCGTALSSHELAQGYEKISENSVYVKFPISNSQFPNTYFLVWTTTPWTLPGNVALAIGPEVEYIKLEAEQDQPEVALKKGDKIILAKGAVDNISGYINETNKYYLRQVGEKIFGKDLIGLEYEPLYGGSGKGKEQLYFFKIVAGDFVSTDEGTGIVHIAPAFGDDDFKLSKKYDLPILATTNERGLMEAPGKPWDGQWFSALGGPASGGKKANEMIIEDLKSRNLLFKEEQYEHDYPFCWRCKNPLMYLARKSWWLDVNKVRQRLLENNETINWHPKHIREGRFGEWLKEEKNWAFSRERYWGTPLPVWRCGKCESWEAVGSLGELRRRSANSGNKYFIMRHGEAETNVKNITNCNLAQNHYQLTRKGRKQVEETIKAMRAKQANPDMIFASPFLRTKETAEMVAKEFRVSQENLKFDPRLGEINTGVFSEGSPKKYRDYFESQLEKFTKTPPKGENLTDLKKRVFAAVSEIENRYQNKTILIISHEYSLWMLWSAAEGKTDAESVEAKEKIGDDFIKTAGIMELNFKNIPRDENLILDLHKPYIDAVILRCGCGGEMRRVPEVCDVWFDSGSMSFASHPMGFPADYIVEAIDQTRGWFYTLLAVATLLRKKAPYKNVISLGHVLDAKGKKMSKSVGNIVEPMALIEKYGADAARWYFFTINQPWDSKLFKEEDVKDASRRFFMILWNILQFYKLYAIRHKPYAKKLTAYGLQRTAKMLINRWVLAKLQELVNQITNKLDFYDIVGAARDLENFITEDVSRWYIRRVREVMKEDSVGAKETNDVLAYLLGEISKLLAPFAPFMAEKLWQELNPNVRSPALPAGRSVSNKTSVHLEDWSGTKELDTKQKELLIDMESTRKIVGLALEARAKAGIRVRQPLARLETKNLTLSIFIKEEVNVKEVVVNAKLADEIKLDITITPELKEEGILRDLIREIQAKRKIAGLKPQDKVSATLELPGEISEVAKKHEKVLMKETNLKFIKISEAQTTKISLI